MALVLENDPYSISYFIVARDLHKSPDSFVSCAMAEISHRTKAYVLHPEPEAIADPWFMAFVLHVLGSFCLRQSV